MEINQIVYIKKSSHIGGPSVYPAKVIKVGRKYVQTQKEGSYVCQKFSLDTFLEEVDSNYRGRLYLTMKEIEDEMEFNDLSNRVKSVGRGYGKLPYSIDQLRRVCEILGI